MTDQPKHAATKRSALDDAGSARKEHAVAKPVKSHQSTADEPKVQIAAKARDQRRQEPTVRIQRDAAGNLVVFNPLDPTPKTIALPTAAAQTPSTPPMAAATLAPIHEAPARSRGVTLGLAGLGVLALAGAALAFKVTSQGQPSPAATTTSAPSTTAAAAATTSAAGTAEEASAPSNSASPALEAVSSASAASPSSTLSAPTPVAAAPMPAATPGQPKLPKAGGSSKASATPASPAAAPAVSAAPETPGTNPFAIPAAAPRVKTGY
ncbi:MAG: hypothetical protein FJ095_12050 [Deltaproteobacteria bacterium]|nr:hypothetical protein [Deltaproteobacteria bacterium]